MTERITLTLTKEEAAGTNLRPEGTYIVSVDDVERTTSRNNNPMYVFTTSILDGPSTGTYKIWATLTQAALFTIRDISKATGFEVKEGEFVIPLPEEFEGKEFAFDVVHEDRTEGKGKDKKVVLGDDGKPERQAAVKRIRTTEAAQKGAKANGAAKARTRRI